jgi:hypothetical protein
MPYYKKPLPVQKISDFLEIVEKRHTEPKVPSPRSLPVPNRRLGTGRLRLGQEASFPLFQKNYVFLLGVGFLFSPKKGGRGKGNRRKN